MPQLVSLLGYAAILGLAWLSSSNRRRVAWRVIAGGTLLQFAFAGLVLRTMPGRRFFDIVQRGFVAAVDCVDAGSAFVFGEGFAEHFFAFKVLASIVFFSALAGALYHLGVLQRVVAGIGWVMQRTLGTSGAETLSAAANIFVGQTEAPIIVRPYLPRMTRSELMAVMTAGFATVAGGVMAAYVGMGVSAGHLLTASVISAPAALMIAKLMEPETGVPETLGGKVVSPPVETVNLLDALAQGAANGVKLALNVGGMLIAFLALIALVELIVGGVGGWFGQAWSLKAALGHLFAPFAWLIGVESKDCLAVGELLGLKTVANEFIAYKRLGEMTELSPRSNMLATYALCGFANFGSIGVQLGGLSILAPERRGDFARLGLRAMIAGNLACFSTACVAGVLSSGVEVAAISAAAKDADGVLVHTVDSPDQSNSTEIRVLLPDHIAPDAKLRVIYVLPVEAASESRYGNGLEEIRRHDLHNRHGVAFVAPTFAELPWYADHPTRRNLRQETFLVETVVPFIERTYPVRAERDGRLLLGFSKSGWGAWTLLLRQPDRFGRAAAWDAPLMMENVGLYGDGPIFGTQENFVKYRVADLLRANAAAVRDGRRLVLTGYGSFREHHLQAHALLDELAIAHHYRDGPKLRHNWHGGWVEEAVGLLLEP